MPPRAPNKLRLGGLPIVMTLPQHFNGTNCKQIANLHQALRDEPLIINELALADTNASEPTHRQEGQHAVDNISTHTHAQHVKP